MSRADAIRFRHNQAILVAAIVAFLGALPLATARWWLFWVLLIPLAVALWAWRAGTDADSRELRLRALAGQRRIPWERVAELTADARGRGVVRLDDGELLVLPAVRANDLPRLISATGQELSDTTDGTPTGGSTTNG
ncbi:PH domain-containing protein [Micromonospora sp. DR5-3]|uniref:PH domain-containing protein n=1 Tax=unclassified Micromonospora TaxID=2617518 RepID=UPI0011D4B9C5|nr:MULTISPECIES: PH domain-containing protein [unclassified Micromonospora]MCW3818456.1 PH domain-containing protein [Micromonospora sp. DR5-3]TYC23196.1 PH domain-containing protein [Micromonospora sp. MP36]